MLGTREYYELIEQFDKQHRGVRLDKEDKTYWAKGNVYQDGHVNEHFRSFVKGYALGKAVGRDESEDRQP